MRTVFKLIVVVAMMATTHLAWASYTFTMKLDFSGSCGGWSSVERSTAQALFDRYVNSVNLGIPSRAECEQARQIIMSEINGIGSGSCKIRVVCGPCTGSGGMGDAPGVNLEGPSKGGSFYSGNASSEIRDWDQQNNALKQMLSGSSTNALPQNTWTASVYKNADSWIADGKGSQEKEFASNARNSKASGFVIDPDKMFTSLNDRPISNGEMVPIAHKPYLEESRLNSLLVLGASYKEVEDDIYRMFYEQAGCKKELLAEIENKPEELRTENERQLLENYYEFKDKCYDYMRRSALEDEGKREIDMSTIAFAMAYDPDQSNKQMQKWLSETTGYKRMDLSQVTVDNPIYNLANLINQKNIDNKDTGFNAQILMREKDAKGEYEYTIVFNGNGNLSSFDPFGKDLIKEFGTDSKHFQAALEIGRAIANLPDNCSVNITGSALAGSWASVAGLASNAPTTTVNAMGVPQQLLDNYGLSEDFNKHNYNITAMVSSDEMKNHLQQIALTPYPQAALLGPTSALGDTKIFGPPGVIDEINNLQLGDKLHNLWNDMRANAQVQGLQGLKEGLDPKTSSVIGTGKTLIGAVTDPNPINAIGSVAGDAVGLKSPVVGGAISGAIEGAIEVAPLVPATGGSILVLGAAGGAVKGAVGSAVIDPIVDKAEGFIVGTLRGAAEAGISDAKEIISETTSAVARGLVINELTEKAEVKDFAKKIGADEKKMKYEKNGKSDFKNDLKIVMYTSSGNQNSQIRWKNWRKLSEQIENQNKKKK